MLIGCCHCESVKWTYEGTPDGVTACNCTVCRRYGVLWAYDYENEGIKATGETTIYTRGEDVEFHFCPTCGCVTYWRGRHADEQGRKRMAVNVRLCEPETVAEFPIDHFEGLVSFEDLPRDGRCVSDYWF